MFPSPGQRCDYNHCTALNYFFMILASETVVHWAKKIQKCFQLFIENSEEPELLHLTWTLIDQSWTVAGCWWHNAPWQTLLHSSKIEKHKVEASKVKLSLLICDLANKVPESGAVLEGRLAAGAALPEHLLGFMALIPDSLLGCSNKTKDHGPNLSHRSDMPFRSPGKPPRWTPSSPVQELGQCAGVGTGCGSHALRPINLFTGSQPDLEN